MKKKKTTCLRLAIILLTAFTFSMQANALGQKELQKMLDTPTVVATSDSEITNILTYF